MSGLRLSDLGLVGVKQTQFGRGPTHGEGYGNCQQAALATYLGVPLDSVPHFLADGPVDGWWERMNAWLLEHHQIAALGTVAKGWDPPPVLHLMVGKTIRNSDHVVVGFGGQMLWDPHPSDAGLIEVTDYEFFLPRRYR